MTITAKAQLRAGIYCRMSLASMGDTTKVDAQERICRQLCKQLGWEVAEGVGHPHPNGAYVDNSLSAWNRKIRRPGWEAMLADVEAGRITAIVVYHGDRLVRQPRDLEKLIDIAEARGTLVASPSGTKDLSKRDDRAMARVIAAFAENEAAAASERRKGQYDRWRLQGKVRPGGRGGRAFGFATDGITHIPGETKLVREAAERVLAGESTGSIARDLAARRVRTPAGNPITHSTLRKMLARPRYAGLMPDELAKAAWEPVLDRQTWEEVRAQLTVRAQAAPNPSNARRWLLSGIAECGTPDGQGAICGSPLQINTAHRRRPSEGPAYRCVKPGCRKVHRKAEFLDAYVTGRMVARLADPTLAEATIPEAPGLAAALLALTERRAEAEQVIASYAGRPERLSVLARALDSIDDRIKLIREQIAAHSGQRILSEHAGITREEFEALPLHVRRALIAAAFRVLVLPASRLGPGFRTEDVKMIRRSPGT